MPQWVPDHQVMVVRHHLLEDHFDAESLRRLREQVGERVVGLVVRAEQEGALRAPPCDEQEALWKHGAWRGHAANTSTKLATAHLDELQVRRVRDVRAADKSVRNPDHFGRALERGYEAMINLGRPFEAMINLGPGTPRRTPGTTCPRRPSSGQERPKIRTTSDAPWSAAIEAMINLGPGTPPIEAMINLGPGTPREYCSRCTCGNHLNGKRRLQRDCRRAKPAGWRWRNSTVRNGSDWRRWGQFRFWNGRRSALCPERREYRNWVWLRGRRLIFNDRRPCRRRGSWRLYRDLRIRVVDHTVNPTGAENATSAARAALAVVRQIDVIS